MNESLLNRILKDHKRRTRSLALILCLSMIVSLGTFAGFHKTAIAKVYTREVLDCPYAREGAEPVAHVHNDDCYDGGTLVCTLPEREAHTHDDTCYAESKMLSCGLEENPGHQHSEECYDENGELICQIPEGEGAHVHTDDCYIIESALLCNQPELPVHVHGPECFRTEEITVDEPEETVVPEQTVNMVPEMPVSDPNADLETSDDWNREFENLELSGNWARDLVLVAATQQGRGESPNNFEAVLNDAGDAWVRHGYTRYGAWYGYPYAEWDAMFVSFCLRYAGIPAENVPNNPTAAFMAESFSMGELFAGRDYIPAVGDLIFFDTVDDEITNIDHMGIVYHVDAENGTINTVEGDRTDAVATFGYHLDDEQIVGYGILPQNPNYIPVEGENTDNTDEALDGLIFMTTDEKEESEETPAAEEAPVPAVPMPAQSWERTAGGIKVSVEAPEGAFPDNTKIAVTPVNGSSLMDTVSDAVDGAVLEVQAVDITFFDENGREIEPAVPIRVTMTPAATEHAEEKTSVVHVDIAQQTAELIEQAEGTEADNSEVVFDAEAFTIYAIVYTVHFEYEVNGQAYASEVPGAQDMLLSEVLSGLNIVAEEELGTFLTKISDVAVSDPDVIQLTPVEGDWSIRPLKNSEEPESLTVTMQDGAVFSVSVEATGVTEVSTEDESAVISTVNDFFLPAEAEAKAAVLTEEESAGAIAAVQAAAPAGEDNAENAADAAAEGTNYQVYSIGLDNVDAADYDGFRVEVKLAEDVKLTGRDFQLYQVLEDGTATDLTGSLELSGEKNEEGLQNLSAFSFTTDDFADFVLSYSIETFYKAFDGQTFKIALNYGPKAGIPDGAELEVREILPEDEDYNQYLNDSAAKLGVESGAVSFARFFDIEIKKDGEKIEPLTPVQVSISLTDAPAETAPEALTVVHFAEAGPETIDETQAAQKEDASVELIFDAESFSVYGVITVPAQPQGVNDLDGRIFTISRSGRYLRTATGDIGNNGNGATGFLKGAQADAATWQFEQVNGSTYYISTIVDGQKKYMHLTEHGSNRADASLSDNPQEFTVTQANGGYRLSATINGTTYYLDEHNGTDGNGFAGWGGQSDNGILSFNLTQSVLQNDEYMTFVKYNDKYYIVNNDATLTEIEYEGNQRVKVENPMEWTVELGSNGHIWHNYKEMGFTSDQRASDFYHAYLDPTQSDALIEENADNIATKVEATHTIPGSNPPETYNEVKLDNDNGGRSEMLTNTAVNIALIAGKNTYTVSHGENYLGVELDSYGNPVRLVGQQNASNAAEFLFGLPEVTDASWKNHAVNHIDISISGTAEISVPLAYGNYYGPQGDRAAPIKTVTANEKLDLSTDQLTKPLKITTEDIERATITAARADNGEPIDNAYYITGYSGNVATTLSNDQVRIEGSFLVADLKGQTFTNQNIADGWPLSPVYENAYNQNWWGYRDAVHNARLANKIEYTVTVVKPLTYKLIDPVVGQLYDEDGKEITVTVDVAFSASFNYWDNEHSANGGNECPPLREVGAWYYYDYDLWQAGGIATHDGSGMDFKLGGNAEDVDSPLVALEITKVVMDTEGNRIELKEPVTNYFDIYENKTADRNGVANLHVNGYGGADPLDETIYNGYTPWHTKRVTVGESGSAIVFDFDATDAMYYIVERHDQDSLPETVTDQGGEKYDYVKTYIETEYVRRGNQYSDKTAYPHPVHVSQDYIGREGSYASIPEVAGNFRDLNGNADKEGFLEFYVYNIYKKNDETVTLPVSKTWADFASAQYSWTAVFQLQYIEKKISGDGPDTSVTEWTNYVPENILTIHKDTVNQETVFSTFGDLPKYVERNGNRYERQYSAEELSFTVWRGSSTAGQMLYKYENGEYTFGDGVDESIYKAFYDHDANENWDGDWNLQISNSTVQKIEPRTINIGLEKDWKPEIPENATATFVLRRYIQTEYADYSSVKDNPTITVQLQNRSGEVLSSIETKSGMNVYVDATFAPDETGTLTFSCNGSSYSVQNQAETDAKVTVRSAAIPVTGAEGHHVIITLTDGDLEKLREGNTYNLRVTDHLTGTDPQPDSSFSKPPVVFPLEGKTGAEAWQYTFENLEAETGEWNADGTLANFNIYSYYLEETAQNPSEDYRLSIKDSNGNIVSSENRIYNENDVTATNTHLGEHIHIEKRWYRLVANQMPPVVIKVTQTVNNVTSDVTQDAYDADGNVVIYSTKYGGYILDKHNGWAIDLDQLASNVKRQFQELGFINGGDPSDGYASGTMITIPTGGTGYDSKHYYFSATGTAPGESEHDTLVGQITTNGGENIYATSGTMFVYNVPNYVGYQVEVHKKWYSFNGSTGMADITDHYGAAEGTGFIMQLQQRARWEGTQTVATEWTDYGKPFEVYIDHNTANVNGFEEVIQGTWLTTVDEKNLSKYGYLYNNENHDYEGVEYDYRFVEVGVIEGNDGRLWSKSTASVNDPEQGTDHRYRLENFEVGKIELQKYWQLKDAAKKASEVYFKIYSDWWFDAYQAQPNSNGQYDVADIIGRDINNPSLSAEEKARTQAYWLNNGVTVKQVGNLGYVFAVSGQGNEWTGGIVRGLPLLKANPNSAGDPANNSYGEVLYTVAEVGAWYNGGLVKVGDSSWPYVDPLYYRNTRNQGLNRVDNGETFQIDNGTVDYQSFFRAINSDIPSWRFHADKTWANMPEQGASVVLELQALRLTDDVLNSLTKTAEQETEGIKVSNLIQDQINTLVNNTDGWYTAEIENPSVVLPKNWDYVSMPETTTEEIAAKNAAAAKAWSVDWAGLPMTWKNASVENPEEYELLYRVVETSSPSWTKYTIGDLTIGENYALSQTVHNEPETSTGDLTITKEWKKGGSEAEWPDGYVINYKVIQHAYLATVTTGDAGAGGTADAGEGAGTVEGQTATVLTYHADTSKPVFDEDPFDGYTSTYGDNQPAENGKITEGQNPVTLHGLPKGAIWTAPTNEDEITEAMTAAGIVAGKTYSIAYAYEVVETGVTSGTQNLPFAATSGSVDVNTTSTGTLENDLTEIKVVKVWTGYTAQTDDQIGVKLYVSSTAPGQTEKINITVNTNWANGTVAPDNLSIPVTITGKDPSGKEAVAPVTFTLTKGQQSVTTPLEKYYDDNEGLITYTVSFGEPSGEVTDVTTTGTNPVSGSDGTITFNATGVVPKNTGSITIENVDFNGTITIAETNPNGNPMESWSGTSIGKGSSVTLTGLKPGAEYFVKLSGFQENGSNPVSSFPSNVRHENWNAEQGYWITATESDTKITLKTKEKVQVTINVVAYGDYAAGGIKSGWKFSNFTPNNNNAFGFNPGELTVNSSSATTSNGWDKNVDITFYQFQFDGIEELGDIHWSSALPGFTANGGQHWGNTNGYFVVSANSGSDQTATITITLGDAPAQTMMMSAPRPMLKAARGLRTLAAPATKTYTGEVTTTTVTLPDTLPENQSAAVVGRAGLPSDAVCLSDTEIILSQAEDSTTGAAWSHLWKDLPKTDAEGNELTYYVVETSAKVSGSTVRATYTRTPATDTAPEIITITNEVENDQKYGSLKVTKELTGVTTDIWWTKEFKFTLQSKTTGQYLNATTHEWQEGTAGAGFTITPKTAFLFDHLPLGNYVITEISTAQELEISAYEYDSENSVKSTSAEGVEVTENNTAESPATFKLENKYTPKVTSVEVTKAWVNADETTTAPTGAEVTFELYQSGTDAAVGTITLDGTVDENGEATAWKASWTDLPMYDADEHEYTYTVKEVVDSNGYSWGAYVVSYPADGTTQEQKTSASNGETITNTEETTDLTVDKKWFADAAAAAAGTPEKEPTQTTIYYKIMQKLGEREATVYTYNNLTVQSLTYDSTAKDWTDVTHNKLPIKVYVADSQNPEDSAWLDATYYVVECDSTGNALVNTDYDVTYQKNSGTAGSDAAAAAISSTDADRTITIINTDALIPVKIVKVDANTTEPLSAVLRITKKNSTNMYEVYPGASDDEIGDDGKFTVSGESGITFSLPAGEYKIEEITPPPGYVISADSTFYFKVENGTVTYVDSTGTAITDSSVLLVKYEQKTDSAPATFTVGNTPGTALPQTGGIGTTLFTALGSLMTATAGAILTIRQRRKPAEG